MVNQYDLIMGGDQNFDDIKKINKTIKLLTQTEQPFFVQIHWMGTHGIHQNPGDHVFYNSRDINTQEQRDDAIYDDNILEFDRGLGKLVSDLKNKNLFDKTILVVSSDHNRNRLTTNRIPLVIHFPDGQYSGARTSDIQLMDIAPTVLDYLGISKPEYMRGDSFLRKELGNRPIFATAIGNAKDPFHQPFYQFGYISIVYCNEWFRYDLISQSYENGKVDGHTDPCGDNFISKSQVTELIINHLASEGFNVSDVESALSGN